MKIAILVQDPTLASPLRLKKASLQRGHQAYILNYQNCSLTVHARRSQIWHSGRLLPRFDAVIPWLSQGNPLTALPLLRQFELMQVPLLNSSGAIAMACNRLHCYQQLAHVGVLFPMTGFAFTPRESGTLLSGLGSSPTVLKLPHTPDKTGSFLAETQEAARSMLEAFQGLNADILAQQYIHEASGSDLRCFVLQDQVVTAILRQGATPTFRANLEADTLLTPLSPRPSEYALARTAIKALGLQVATIDMLRTHEGPMVVNVNPFPALEPLEAATQQDLATSIIAHLAEMVQTQFPTR